MRVLALRRHLREAQREPPLLPQGLQESSEEMDASSTTTAQVIFGLDSPDAVLEICSQTCGIRGA